MRKKDSTKKARQKYVSRKQGCVKARSGAGSNLAKSTRTEISLKTASKRGMPYYYGCSPAGHI